MSTNKKEWEKVGYYASLEIWANESRRQLRRKEGTIELEYEHK